MPRSTRAVFESHLRLRLEGRVDEDIRRNYAGAVVILSRHGVYRGHAGVRRYARRLARLLPKARFTYARKLVRGPIAYLEWRGRSPSGRRVCNGVDTFLIRDGRIAIKTVHYTIG